MTWPLMTQLRVRTKQIQIQTPKAWRQKQGQKGQGQVQVQCRGRARNRSRIRMLPCFLSLPSVWLPARWGRIWDVPRPLGLGHRHKADRATEKGLALAARCPSLQFVASAPIPWCPRVPTSVAPHTTGRDCTGAKPPRRTGSPCWQTALRSRVGPLPQSSAPSV